MPTRTQLEGHHVPFAKDEFEGVIEAATFIQRDDGKQEFVLRGCDDDSTHWEAHLYSPDGREFSGRMASTEWSWDYLVHMELWLSPSDDGNVLLLGTYQLEDASEVPVDWRITLWPPEDD